MILFVVCVGNGPLPCTVKCGEADFVQMWFHSMQAALFVRSHLRGVDNWTHRKVFVTAAWAFVVRADPFIRYRVASTCLNKLSKIKQVSSKLT